MSLNEALEEAVYFDNNTFSAIPLDTASNVTLTDLSNNQILVFNGTSWYNGLSNDLGLDSVVAGTGLSGGTITTTGTIALNAELNDLSNVSASSLSNNDVLLFSSNSWSATQLPEFGVSSITAGTGLSGGTITSTGTIALNSSISGLNDVTVDSPSDSYIFIYNSSTDTFEASAVPPSAVSSVTAGTGLTGGTITSTGTISFNTFFTNLDDFNDVKYLANIVLSDNDILIYREAGDEGAGWYGEQRASFGVQSIATGTGLTGGPITTTGTIFLNAALNDLSDVSTAGVSTNYIIEYDSGSWSAVVSATEFINRYDVPEAVEPNPFPTYSGVGDEYGADIDLGTNDAYDFTINTFIFGTGVTPAITFDSDHIKIYDDMNPCIGDGAFLSGTDLTVAALFDTSDPPTYPYAKCKVAAIASTDSMTIKFGGETIGTGDALLRKYRTGTTGAFRSTAFNIRNFDGPITFDNGDTENTLYPYEFYTNTASAIKLRIDGEMVPGPFLFSPDELAASFEPGVNNTYSLGNASYLWTDIYAANTTINTSDRDKKADIQTSDLGKDFINALRPVSYKFLDGSRTHYGLIAQEVEEALEKLNKTTQDFAGYIANEDMMGLRYTEFLSPIMKAIQEIKQEFDGYVEEIKDLEIEINSII